MYGKIFDSIYNGTLYGKWEALVTMQQLIVLADADGVVDMTPQAISARTSIPREIIDKGLEVLAAPDKYTRTEGSDGRRIELIDEHRPWGWVLVNYEKYKSMVDSDTVRAQTRERVRRHRERKKNAVTECNGDVTDGNGSKRHIDIDIDIDTDKPKRMVAAATGFEDFWQVYPKKRKRKQCLDVWKRRKLGTMKDFLIADVESRITGDQRWVKGFVPDPLTYLRGDRWEDELSDQKTSREQTYAEQLKSWIDANATD